MAHASSTTSMLRAPPPQFSATAPTTMLLSPHAKSPTYAIPAMITASGSSATETHSAMPSFFRTSPNSTRRTHSASGFIIMPQLTAASPIQQPQPQPQPPTTQVQALLLAPLTLIWPFLTPAGRLQPEQLQADAVQIGTSFHAVLNLSGMPPDMPQQAASSGRPGAEQEAGPRTAALASPHPHPLQQQQQEQQEQQEQHEQNLHALPAQLLGSFCCVSTASALQTALQALAAGRALEDSGSWQLTWSLSRQHPPPSTPATTTNHAITSPPLPPPPPSLPPLPLSIVAHASFALLRVSVPAHLIPRLLTANTTALLPAPYPSPPLTAPSPAPSLKVGTTLHILGSPFGCLAPSHFAACTVAGCLSACLPGSDHHMHPAHPSPPSTSQPTSSPLLMVDAACFPGMEGALVSAAQPGSPQYAPRVLVAVLLQPLSRASDGVQVQLAVPWDHVLHGLSTALHAAALLEGPLGAQAATGGQVTLQPAAAAVEGRERHVAQLAAGLGGANGVPPSTPQLRNQPVRQLPSEAAGLWSGGQGQAGAHTQQSGEQQQRATRSAARGASSMAGHGSSLERQTADAGASTGGGGTSSAAGGGGSSAVSSQPIPGISSGISSRTEAGSSRGMGVEDESGFPPLGASVEAALRGIVLVRSSNSWATGIVVSETGVVITNAHLLQPPRGRHPPSIPPDPDLPTYCSVRLSSGAAGASSGTWIPAQVLYVFRNHLDVAVLQMVGVAQRGLALWPLALGVCPLPAGLVVGSRHDDRQPAACPPEAPGEGFSGWAGSAAPQPDARAGGSGPVPGTPRKEQHYPGDQRPLEGRQVLVLGHGLFGPAMVWPAAATAGNICKAVCASGQQSMLITTAAVHAGASGAAVVDAEDGALLGMVTSNARHAGGATLSRLNFCIAADELRGLLRVTQSLPHLAEASPRGAGKGLLAPWDSSSCRPDPRCYDALSSLDVLDRQAERVWQLQSAGVEDEFETEVFLGPASKL